MSEASSYQSVVSKIEEAEKRAKRPVGSTNLIAVSKTKTQDEILPVLQANHRIFGENRVQEAQSKWPELRKHYDDIELHLIGPLQSNKSAEAVALFDFIHTIDREKIVITLCKAMGEQGKMLPCTIQVNTGLEPQKAGIDPRETKTFLEFCRAEGLNIEGLMCIPPADENPGPHFALLQKLAAENNLAKISMGMSGDFETAISFGASHIRVGSAIFGARQ